MQSSSVQDLRTWADTQLSRDRANRKQPTLSFKPETISTGATRHIHHPPIPFLIPSSLPGISWACGRSHTPLKTRYYTRETSSPVLSSRELADQLSSSWLWNPELSGCNQSSEQFKRGDPWTLTIGTPSLYSLTPVAMQTWSCGWPLASA